MSRDDATAGASFSGWRCWAWTAASLALLLAWDASGWDLPLAARMGGQAGFPLQHQALLDDWLHPGERDGAIVLALALFAGIWRPWGPFRRLTRGERAWGVLTAAAAAVLIGTIKHLSATSCPWDMQMFGGTLPYVSHWDWNRTDGGGGRCFPAGHASAAFAFMGIGLPLAAHGPAGRRLARIWLAGVMLAGLAFGLMQQLRGAHYMSHTLWTAWLCWALSLASWQLHARCRHA